MTRFSYCWLIIFVAVLITDPAFPDSVISPLIPPAPGRSGAPGRLVLLLQISASGARLSLDNGEKPASGVPADTGGCCETFASVLHFTGNGSSENPFGGFLSAAAQSGLDSMKITVAGNEQRMLLLAVYDNLGKGASGAAVECMNLVTGAEKTLGLEL